MRIDKTIDSLLKKRTRAAKKLMNVCYDVDQWLRLHEVEPDSSCWGSGAEVYFNPEIAEKEVRQAIKEKRVDE